MFDISHNYPLNSGLESKHKSRILNLSLKVVTWEEVVKGNWHLCENIDITGRERTKEKVTTRQSVWNPSINGNIKIIE